MKDGFIFEKMDTAVILTSREKAITYAGNDDCTITTTNCGGHQSQIDQWDVAK
jgi:hypothetical protein